jgi:hypothetical protein
VAGDHLIGEFRQVRTLGVRRRPRARSPLDRYLEYLQRLFTHCPELARALVRAFAAMFDTGDPAPLPDWLNQLDTSRLPGLPSLAKVIREDLLAVATRH